jgi:tetratricopeptide (TPR) repeat protein
MRGHLPPASTFSVDVLARAVLDEFPELDPARVATAIERGIARAASTALDTEAYRVVDLQLARAEATEESVERAAILRELAEMLEQRGDAERAIVVRGAAFAAAPSVVDLDPLLRLGQITERWSELPLEQLSALIGIDDDESPRRLRELAHAWQRVGRMYHAADCLERVLLLHPEDAHANEALEVFYRSTGEWPVLVDLLQRRAVHVVDPKERAELFREIGLIYDRELADHGAAFEAYQESDRLAPGHPEVVGPLARLGGDVGLSEEEVLASLEHAAAVITEPKARAATLCRAAELARNQDWDKALQLFERARAADPDLAAAVDGLSVLRRDRGELSTAADLLVEASERPALAAERSRWLADAADFQVALGDFEDAKELYRRARRADLGNHRAGVALVELCWDTGSLVELAPILDDLCRTTDDPERLRHYLLQRSKVAQELGEVTSARDTLARVVDLDPGDAAARRALGDLLFENQEWARARPLLEGQLDDEDQLPPDDRVVLHYRIARASHELGDDAAAAKHAGIALALGPGHRASLLLRAELENPDEDALLADQLALANTAPFDERAARFAALGDRYLERGDRATAREMFREALGYKPDDHMLLNKALALVADEGDWSYSLDLLQRLTDTEKDPRVRARYRHAAAQILRDELRDVDRTAHVLELAIEDDPLAFVAADDLEALLAAAPPGDRLVEFYYLRLEHVRAAEGRPGERQRLWDRLGEVCLQLGRTADAVVAFEVAQRLAPDDPERALRLADLYLAADPKHDANAIALHQQVLRGSRRRVASYEALRTLYARGGRPDKARAVDEALALLATRVVAAPSAERVATLFDQISAPPFGGAARSGPFDQISAPPFGGAARSGPFDQEGRIVFGEQARRAEPRTLTNEDWNALARVDVDLQLSAVFALVAPAFAADRARLRPPPAPPPREYEVPSGLAKVLARVAAIFGISTPPVYVSPGARSAAQLAMRVRGGALAPILTLGPDLEGRPDEELAFELARELADLRTDRVARLLCPRPGELAQIVELALTLGDEPDARAAQGNRWVSTALHPVELEQVRTLGRRLRDKGLVPMTAALGWLAATERAADRIGLVVAGDLAACVRVLEREEAGDGERALELIWGSVTEEVLGVRFR